MSGVECTDIKWAGTAYSGYRIATGWTFEEMYPGGVEIFPTRPDRPGANPTSYTMGTGSFPGITRPGCSDNHPPHLAPSLKKK